MDRTDFDQRLRAAHAAFRAEQWRPAIVAFQSLIADAAAAQELELAVRAQLEFVACLTSVGQHTQAAQELEQAEEVASRCAFPLCAGDFAEARAALGAVTLSSQVERDGAVVGDVTEQYNAVLADYLQAISEYRNAGRSIECANAAARYADVVALAGDAVATIGAHRYAIEIVDAAPIAPEWADGRKVHHLRQVGIHAGWSGRGMEGVVALVEARTLTARLGEDARTAEIDVVIGDFYRTLGLESAARAHWDQAIDWCMSTGEDGAAQLLVHLHARMQQPERGFDGRSRGFK